MGSNDEQTGPKRWNKTIPMEKTNWRKKFKLVPKTCRENRLREFNFKFIRRIVVTKKGSLCLILNQIVMAYTVENQTL